MRSGVIPGVRRTGFKFAVGAGGYSKHGRSPFVETATYFWEPKETHRRKKKKKKAWLPGKQVVFPLGIMESVG